MDEERTRDDHVSEQTDPVPESSPGSVQPPSPPRRAPLQSQKYPAITERMIQSLKGIGPWTRFLAIMGFVSVAFMLAAAAFMLAFGFLGRNFGQGTLDSAMMIVMSLLYVVLALAYVFPAVFLWNTAGAVVRLKRGDIVGGFETALAKQKSFWKFVGILVAVLLALYPILIITVVFLGMMGALQH